MKKHITAILLSAMLILQMIPISVFAENSTIIYQGFCGDDLSFTIDNNYTLTISGTGDMDHFNSHLHQKWSSYRERVKTIVIEEGVTSIGKYAFEGFTALKSVQLPSTLTHIYYEAFYDCTALTDLTLPDGLTEIHNYCFTGCTSLTSINIPDSVTYLGGNAFSDCTSLANLKLSNQLQQIPYEAFKNCSSLTSLIIPDSVLNLETGAFAGCDSLTTVTIPKNVCSAYSVFYDCDHLEKILVDSENEYYYSEHGILFSKDKSTIIQYPAGKSGSYVIPEYVETLMFYSFAGCDNLTAITIGDHVTAIEEYAFSNCNGLTSVTIPDSITELDTGVFEYCTSLKNVYLPNTLTTLGDYTFQQCTTLTSITIPDSVTQINAFCFSGCCSLSDVHLSANLEMMDYWAFSYCSNLTDIELPDGLLSLDATAFSGTSITELTVPSSVTNFVITNPTQDMDIIFLGDAPTDGFWCSSINEYDSFGESLDEPEYYTLTIYYPVGNTTWTDDIKSQTEGNIVWREGDGSEGETSGSCGENLTWSIVDGVLTISGTGDMSDFTYTNVPWRKSRAIITSVVIEDGVTSIGNYSFIQCSNLTSITVPDSIVTIGECAFYHCSKLKEISLPDTITTIGSEAFYNCDSLTSLPIPTGVKEIASGTFYGCAGLTTITIPEQIISIGTQAFGDCNNLMEFIVHDNNAYYSSFHGALLDKEQTTLLQYPCDNEAEYTVPATVTAIAEQAFRNASLQELWFEGDAPSFCTYSMYQMSGNVYYPFNAHGWANVIQEQYGGTITWLPYDPETGEILSGNQAADLVNADYLSFAAIAYRDFANEEIGMTIEDILADCWDTDWKNSEIKSSILFDHISSWTLKEIFEDASLGFYAVAFENAYGEVMIAYRGSTNILEMFYTWDGFSDWFINDFPMEVFNELGPQIEPAINVYEKIAETTDVTNIYTTGHSLGGALANVVSAYSGCSGQSVNAISVLDTVYDDSAILMGRNFAGVNEWNFMDNANSNDAAAGMFEKYWTTVVKPYTSYVSDYPGGNLATGQDIVDILSSHDIFSLLNEVDGKLVMNDALVVNQPSDIISSLMTNTGRAIEFGTSYSDVIDKGLSLPISRSAFGGNGADTITTSIESDTIIGGRGNDALDGSYGNDNYIYYKGDGIDTIHDVGGSDRLYLYDFSEDDTFEIYEDETSSYIDIKCNGTTIVQISKDNREYKNASINSFRIYVEKNGETTMYNISESFKKSEFGSHLVIACPVSIRVLDSDGREVFLLEDGMIGNEYTEFGNFYIFEEENGEYGKVLDLIEGYTIEIIGTDTGTMDISHWKIDEGTPSETETFEDIEISPSFSAILNEHDDGEISLAMDTDGDSQIDDTLTFVKPDVLENPFIDVREGDYFYYPVLWAVDNSITSGVSQTRFEPETACTRAQAVTFLWRQAGKPEPTTSKMPFTDVGKGLYYEKAVLWAVENGIATGTSSTTFSPDAKCTRGQIVTFLWRFNGKPAVATENPFADVAYGEYYYEPVLWAVQAKITTGTSSTTFGPNANCTRGQIVTFLYRNAQQ